MTGTGVFQNHFHCPASWSIFTGGRDGVKKRTVKLLGITPQPVGLSPRDGRDGVKKRTVKLLPMLESRRWLTGRHILTNWPKFHQPKVFVELFVVRFLDRPGTSRDRG